VRVHHHVIFIDAAAQQIRVHDSRADREFPLDYDELVIATGASAFVPPIDGVDLPGVFLLRDLDHGAAIKGHLATAAPASAVIIGGGYIGLEMAEALTARGLRVTLLEMMDQVVPGWHPDVAATIQETLAAHGVKAETGVRVSGIEAAGDGLTVRSDRGDFAGDMVLVSVGVRPEVHLARAAGVTLGATGAIEVDAHMRTNLSHVFAAGDCAEAFHLVARRPVYLPLGDTANKQGKVAGANAAGGDETFAGIVGSAGFKVFELEVARTGLGQPDIDNLQLDAVVTTSKQGGIAGSYRKPSPIRTVMFAEKGSGRLLGAQMVGAGVVGKRIDILATALHAGMTVRQVEGLDLTYAPPISPVYDPVLIAATVTKKALARG
jgi:NADPH-dependent 2,4-dienoyl-CoA reductase/sulfur reductase-like enzyme